MSMLRKFTAVPQPPRRVTAQTSLNTIWVHDLEHNRSPVGERLSTGMCVPLHSIPDIVPMTAFQCAAASIVSSRTSKRGEVTDYAQPRTRTSGLPDYEVHVPQDDHAVIHPHTRV